METLHVRSVLVTGSDRGVGLGLVTRFLEKQDPPEWVFATSLDLDRYYGKELPNTDTVISFQKLRRLALCHPNLVVLQLDIRDLKSIEAAVRKVEQHVKENGLTLLINNAGILVKFTCLAYETAEDMARLYGTNTIGTLQVSQFPNLQVIAGDLPLLQLIPRRQRSVHLETMAAFATGLYGTEVPHLPKPHPPQDLLDAFLPLLKTAALGSPEEGLSCSKAAIVNISSDFGSIEKMAGWSLSQVISYRCSKAALNMLTRCQSLEYKQFGVLSLSIHPGWVKTAMGSLLLPTTVEDSTMGILKVLSAVTERDTGSFLDWEGNTVPW